SELGHKVKSIIEAGHLVPNEVVMEIVEDFMSKLPKNTAVLFDGIPRKVEQAQSLNELLKKHNRTYKAVLIDIKKETAFKRLATRRVCKSCKNVYPTTYTNSSCECNGELVTRADDNPEAIKTRLEAFEKETIPTINIYKDNLIKIDGEPTIKEVEILAFKALDGIMPPPSNS
ncbi:hypothetical protein A3I58_03470, partial [Candidatus Peregrinibacteria bacterium RIFCSPLOWO2_02_FULL_39_10]